MVNWLIGKRISKINITLCRKICGVINVIMKRLKCFPVAIITFFAIITCYHILTHFVIIRECSFLLRGQKKRTKEKATFFVTLRAKKEALRCYVQLLSSWWRCILPILTTIWPIKRVCFLPITYFRLSYLRHNKAPPKKSGQASYALVSFSYPHFIAISHCPRKKTCDNRVGKNGWNALW